MQLGESEETKRCGNGRKEVKQVNAGNDMLREREAGVKSEPKTILEKQRHHNKYVT